MVHIGQTAAPVAVTSATTSATRVSASQSAPGFGDLIDIVNPLQHIPVVNNVYQNITGDTINPVMKIAGGALYGGPIGALFALVTTIAEAMFEEDSAADADTMIASEGSGKPTGPAQDAGSIAYQQALVSLGVVQRQIDVDSTDPVRQTLVQTGYATVTRTTAHQYTYESATESLIQQIRESV